MACPDPSSSAEPPPFFLFAMPKPTTSCATLASPPRTLSAAISTNMPLNAATPLPQSRNGLYSTIDKHNLDSMMQTEDARATEAEVFRALDALPPGAHHLQRAHEPHLPGQGHAQRDDAHQPVARRVAGTLMSPDGGSEAPFCPRRRLLRQPGCFRHLLQVSVRRLRIFQAASRPSAAVGFGDTDVIEVTQTVEGLFPQSAQIPTRSSSPDHA
uniref:Uncharacterized protein n=1 Tax=Mycena chlorophos TaxID=658473 RepID=A0ABQ0LMF2_MYCCL|nr:predicted protein [Mycena chlorophos]